MAQADTLSTGASHAGINPRSTVSLGQVIYTQGHGRICTRPSLFNRHTHDRVFAHTTAANNRGKLWKPVTVFKSAVMGVLFKVLRNRVKVWQRSRFELVQSPTGWGPAVLLQPSPPHRWGGGGGQERITHTHATTAWKLMVVFVHVPKRNILFIRCVTGTHSYFFTGDLGLKSCFCVKIKAVIK